MKRQLCNEEITRIIERENVITFKRKNEQKQSLKSQKQEDEEDVKSKPNEESNFHTNTKRNVPLPQINRERKRLALKAPDAKPPLPAYFEKEVRQRDNIMLKNANNHLASENIKLKTKNINLEREALKLQKMLEEDPQKLRVVREGRHGQSISLKIAMRNLKKQLEQSRKQNLKIKTSIKFTTVSQLEVQRDAILEESQRLRELLEEQRSRCNYLKTAQQSSSQLELKQLQDRNSLLSRQNTQLKSRASKGGEDRERGSLKYQEIQKNISRQLLNARNTIKQKDRQIEYLKQQIKRAGSHQEPLKIIETQTFYNSKSREIKSQMSNKAESKGYIRVGKEKRLMSKSAQKYRSQAVNIEPNGECKQCKHLREANSLLQANIEEMKIEIEKFKAARHSLIDDFSRNPMKPPTEDEVAQVKRFLIHRFKAHHLTLDEAVLHLLSSDNQINLETEVSIGQLLQISMAEPFSILSDRYIEAFIFQVCYQELPDSTEPILIEESKMIKKKMIRENFIKLIDRYELATQEKEDEMFIQIAQLVTHYQQHIHKALDARRNSENTVAQKDFYDFFKEIELEVQYIDFMISQIILESLDLDHLNIYNLFEIFYMPQEQPAEEAPQKPGKNKFKMIETVVKQEDEEYEQSKSFLDSKQKSNSMQQECTYNPISEVQSPIEHITQGEQQRFEEQKKEEKEEYKKGEKEEYKKGEKEEQKPKQLPQRKEKHEHYEIELQNADEEYIEDYEN